MEYRLRQINLINKGTFLQSDVKEIMKCVSLKMQMFITCLLHISKQNVILDIQGLAIKF